MKSRISKFALWAVLAIPAICSAQGVRYDNVVLLDSGRPVQGASITVCASGSSGTPCTPTTSIFTDVALSSPITQPGFQSGAQGNFNFYAACGKYDISFTGNGLTSRTMKDVQLGPCGNFNATVKRIMVNQGTALVAGDFVAAGWGTGPTVTPTGRDAGFNLSITAGTTPSANPTAVLTFHDGTWTNTPVCVALRTDSTAPTGNLWEISAQSAIAITLLFRGTPTAAASYTVNVICQGK